MAMPWEFRMKLIVNLATTLVVLAILIGLTFYLRADISAKADTLSSIHGELIERTKAFESLNSLRMDAKSVAPLFDKLRSILPKRDLLFNVQKDFQSLAQANKLGFNSQFGAESPETPDSPGKIRLEMAVQGSYNDILEFVKGIDASPYFINVINMDLVRQGGNFNANLSSEVSFHD
jgi:Tfp pilus assembly protein PilO